MRSPRVVHVLACLSLSLALPTGLASGAQVLVTHDQAAKLFGGKRALVAWGEGTSVYFADLSDASPAPVAVCSDGAGDYRSLTISPDGQYVAYSTGFKAYVRKIEANSTSRISVGDGSFPTWWKHPQTGKPYIVYQAADGLSIRMQEIDLAGMTTVGAATTLINNSSLSWFQVTGGRSVDGKFMVGDDAMHGTIEIADPLAVADVVVRNYAFYTSPLGYQNDGSHLRNERYAGWCNANVSPAAPGRPYYGFVQHMGSEHTDEYVRAWPADLGNTGTIDPKNTSGTLIDEFKASSVGGASTATCALVSLLPLISMPAHDGNTHYHGTFWSTHENYLCGKEGGSKNDGTWYGYVYDITDPSAPTYARVLSKSLNKGSDFLHLWVEVRDVDVALRAPTAGRTIYLNDKVPVTAWADGVKSPVASVEFFANGSSIGTATQPPWTVEWTAGPKGTVTLTAVARDGDGRSQASYPVNVEVLSNPVLTSVEIYATCPFVEKGGSLGFAAMAYDQHGDPMDPQPSITWTVEGGGSIDASGVLIAPAGAASITVKADAGGVSGSKVIEVRDEVAFRYARVVARSKPENFINSAVFDITWHSGGVSYPAAPMTANDTPSPLSASISFAKDPSTVPQAFTAFDSNKGDGPAFANGNLPCTLTIDLGSATMPMPDAVTLITRTGNGREVTGVACDVSIDGITWYTLYDASVKVSGTLKLTIGEPIVPVAVTQPVAAPLRTLRSPAVSTAGRAIRVSGAQPGDRVVVYDARGRVRAFWGANDDLVVPMPGSGDGFAVVALERGERVIARATVVVAR